MSIKDGAWRTGSWAFESDQEALAWAWDWAEEGQWVNFSWHELSVIWEDYDYFGWSYRSDHLQDYLYGYLYLYDPPPSISYLVPSAAVRGESGQVTIYGEHFGQNPWVDVAGTGVTMQVTAVGQGWIQVDYSIESNAESGDHAVTGTTTAGTSNPVPFTVQDPAPVVNWIDPDIWEAGWSNVPVTIYGSGFGGNPVVNAGSWAQVSVQWSTGTEIHATVSVDPNAPDTMETVTVTSRGWGGQGFIPAPGANPTANATVQLRSAPQPVATVAILSASIPEDRIQVELAPQGLSGTLTVELVRGGTSHTVFSGTRGGGVHDISFNIPNLPTDEFSEVRATWQTAGQNPSATYSYHIKVLGDYQHTQYNTPDENACSGNPQEFTYITERTCWAINCNTAETATAMGKSDWLAETSQNGTGLHSTLNYIWAEGQCLSRASYRGVPGPCPACGGDLIPHQHVARKPGHPDLSCGDTVYIHGVGVRTVKDSGSAGSSFPMNRLDHYIGVSGCNQAGSYGSRKTIKLF